MLCRYKRFPCWQDCRSALRHTQQADALNCNETICQHRSHYYNDHVAGSLARENIFCSHRVPAGQKMRKDRELYSFFIQTLQTSSSLICRMFCFPKFSCRALFMTHYHRGVMDLFSFPLLPRGYIQGFFFFFRFPVLYHSLSSFSSFIPFVQCKFRLLSFFPFFFFFLFSSFSKKHRSSGGARAKKKRWCVF